MCGMSWEPVIGLEIHAQLLTASKIFCGCPTAFGAPPNTQVCPVCLGLPGALPVLNRRALDLAATAAIALGCRVQPRSIFARKNYFYPDLPKGYQISQYELPLATGGALVVPGTSGPRLVRLARLHLEEDAGKSLHEGFADSDRRSYVDFNRAGVPLIEIVTEPDLRSAGEAAAFFEALREVLVWTGVNDGNMEEGSLRCDANVSVRRAGTGALGTKTEVKNLNSFRFLQKALEYEIARQVDVLARGEHVEQETRLFDAAQGRTYAMRSKEEAHDYRYFPEPDLPPVVIDEARLGALAGAVPELPAARRQRLAAEYDLPDYDAAVLTQSRAIADYFEATARAAGNPKAASNWIMGELLRRLKESAPDVTAAPVSPAALAELIRLVDRGTIGSATAKAVFDAMWRTGRGAAEIVEAQGLRRIADASSLEPVVARVLAEHAAVAADVRAGKPRKLQFLVGQVMKATGGQADPVLATELVRRAIEEG